MRPAAMAAYELGYNVTVGDEPPSTADCILVGKVVAQYSEKWLSQLAIAKKKGTLVIVDYTDHHINGGTHLAAFYLRALKLSSKIIVPSDHLRDSLLLVDGITSPIFTIEDPLEVQISRPKRAPRLNEDYAALWFGHGSNFEPLLRFIAQWPQSAPNKLNIVSSPEVQVALGEIPISCPTLLDIDFYEWNLHRVEEIARVSTMCIIPSTLDSHKLFASSNRLVTSLALGLPTVATIIPSYEEFREFCVPIDSPDVNLIFKFPEELNQRIEKFQNSVSTRFHIDTIISNWKSVV